MKEYRAKNQNQASMMDQLKELGSSSADVQIGNQAMLSILGQKEGISSKTLSEDMTQKMSDQFGVPMTGIKVFENENLNAIGETAYAHGNEIHVAKGKYNPYSEQGQQVLMHEAAHVVQQGMGMVHGTEESPALEAQAHAAQSGEGLGMSGGFTMPVANAAAPIQGFGGGIRKALGKMWGGVKNFFKGLGKSKGNSASAAPAPKKVKQSPEEKTIAELGNNPDLTRDEFDRLEGAVAQQAQGWQSSLTPGESDAVNYYTSNEFFGMNRYLRGAGSPAPQKAAEYDQQAANLSAALSKARTTSDMVLHRGVKGDFVQNLLAQAGIKTEGMNWLQLMNAAKGAKGALSSQVFEDKGFTSTSLSKDVAKQFAGKGMNVMDAEKISHLIEYHAPKGTKAGYVEGLSSTPEEFEMLLDRGQKYRIRDIVDSEEFGGGSLKFIIDLLNDDDDGTAK